MKFLQVIYYTVYEIITKLTLLFYLGIGTVALIGVALSISGTFVDGVLVAVSMFGKTIPVTEDFNPINIFLFFLINGSLAGMIFLGVFSTAGVIPGMLEKGTIDIYLSKPVSRLFLLAAKSAGAIAAMSAAVLYFMLGLYLIIGVRLGIWNHDILLAALYSIGFFVTLYSLVVLGSVLFRSVGVVYLIVYMHLFVVSPALQSRHELINKLIDFKPFHYLTDVLFYLLPQSNGLQANIVSPFNPEPDFIPAGTFPEVFGYSFLSALLLYALAYLKFRRSDY